MAKFAFIFYMQRVKDMYCNRLKTKRELQPAKTGGGGMASHGSMSPPVGDLDFSGAASPGYNITAQDACDLARRTPRQVRARLRDRLRGAFQNQGMTQSSVGTVGVQAPGRPRSNPLRPQVDPNSIPGRSQVGARWTHIDSRSHIDPEIDQCHEL